MSLAQRALRGTAYVLVSSYANMAAGLLYGMVMARLLEPEHFGIVALGLFFFSMADLQGKLGLDYALIHRPAALDKLLATHWVLGVGSAALTTLLLLAATPVLMAGAGYLARWGYHLQVESILAMLTLGLITLIDAAGRTARASLEKELAFGSTMLVGTTALLTSYATGIGLAALGLTYWAILGQMTVNVVLTTVGSWLALRRAAPGVSYPLVWDGQQARWMLRYGLRVAVGAVATVVLLGFDNFLVGLLAGSAALGFYAQAYKTAQWPTGLVTHIIARTSVPTYAKVQSDLPRLSRAFEMSLWMILTLALPLALGLFITAPEFVLLLYGEKWLPAAALIRLLLGYAALRPLLDDTGALFVAIGQPGRISRVLVVQASVLVVTATPLTWRFGAEGAAVAVGIAFAAGILLTYHYVGQTVTIRLLPLFGPALLATLAALGVGLGLNEAGIGAAWPLVAQVAFKGICVAAAYALVSLLLQGRTAVQRVQLVLSLLWPQRPAAEA